MSRRDDNRLASFNAEVKRLMQCGMTEEEARETAIADLAIEQGADPFPLTAEQEKASKQARATGTRKTEYQFSKRERKPDPDKRCLIDLLFQSLDPQADAHPTITNPERQIDFAYNGRKFRIILSAPRAPK